MPNINLKEVYDTISGDYKAGLAERKVDKSQGMSTLIEAIKLFDENYGKGAEKTALADYNQSAVTSGLSGSTRGAAVSAGMKNQFEDVRRGRLGDALAQFAQFLSGFNSGAPNAGNLGYIATGGFGAQSNLEAQRFAQDQASFPSVISGNQQGLGYQPSSSGGGGYSRSQILNPANMSGSAGSSGSAWGGIPSAQSQQQTDKPRPTYAGMWATQEEPDDPSAWAQQMSDAWLDPSAQGF